MKALPSFEKKGVTRRHDITNQMVTIRNVIAAYEERLTPNVRILSQFNTSILRTVSKYRYNSSEGLSYHGGDGGFSNAM